MKKVDNEILWIMYDRASGQRIGIYGSKDEAIIDCPTWKEEGYVIERCEIAVVKKHRSAT